MQPIIDHSSIEWIPSLGFSSKKIQNFIPKKLELFIYQSIPDFC